MYNDILDDLEKYDMCVHDSFDENNIRLRNIITFKVSEMQKNKDDKSVLGIIDKIEDLILSGHYSNPCIIYGIIVTRHWLLNKCTQYIIEKIRKQPETREQCEYVCYAKYSPTLGCTLFLSDFNNNGEVVWSFNIEAIFNDYRTFLPDEMHYFSGGKADKGLQEIDYILHGKDSVTIPYYAWGMTKEESENLISRGVKVKYIDKEYFIKKYMEE